MKEIFFILIQALIISAENLITFSEFRKAVTDNVYPAPTREQYNTIINMALPAGNITTKQELAMFLAQVLWESAGLQAKKEIKCASNGCPSSYRTGREKSGKYYYGRGYIQLTWLYNYEHCSKDLYGDNRLVDDPDLVSDTEEGAWGSAFWYWAQHCHKADGVKDGMFGASTMAINGALECKGPYKVKAFKRFTIYVRVLKAFKLNDIKPLQDGCYPMDTDFRLCDAVGPHKNAVGMYHWCNDNCNADDPNCPQDLCGCEGGNPLPKAKNKTLDDTQPKVETNIEQIIKPVRIPYRGTPKPQIKPERQPERQPERPEQDSGPTEPPTSEEQLLKSMKEYVEDPIDESEPEHNLFRYQEPMRNRKAQHNPITTTTEKSIEYIESTTNIPDLRRARIYRNELGRLIRRRPVVRTQSPLEQ